MTVKVTIEQDGKVLALEEYESFSLTENRGINRVYGPGDRLLGLEPTGSQICVIKLWKGCPTFESHDQGNTGC